MTNRIAHTSLVITSLLLAGLVGCGGSSPTDDDNSGADDIRATAALQFLPPTKTVTAGSQVTWDFGAVAHTVVFDGVSGHPADIATATANQKVSRTFTTAGTYPYHCTIHAGMTGTVVVTAAASSVPAPAPAPAPPPPAPDPGYP